MCHQRRRLVASLVPKRRHVTWVCFCFREMYRTQLETLTLRQTQQLSGPTFLTGASKLAPIAQSTRKKTLSRAIKETSEVRKLSKFEQQQKIWVDTVMELAHRTGHLPEDLAMQRGTQCQQACSTSMQAVPPQIGTNTGKIACQPPLQQPSPASTSWSWYWYTRLK
jgi:hypothetical protein